MTHEVCAFWKDPAWIGAVAGVAAAVAAIISLLYQRAQIKVTIKEKWVNDVRHDLAEVLESVMQVLLVSKKAAKLVDKMRGKTATDDDYREERIAFKQFKDYEARELAARYRLLLFLDEKKSFHRELSGKLQNWVDFSQEWREVLFDKEADKRQLDKMEVRSRAIQGEIIAAGQAMIKDELGIK